MSRASHPATRHASPSRARGLRRRSALAVAAALALTAGLGACTDDDPDEPATDVPAEIGDAATLEPSTTTTAAPSTDTTPTTTAAPTGAPDPEAAATVLYDAWKADDRATAATVAEAAAVDGIFAAAPGDYALYNRCNTGEFGSSNCLYRGDAGTIQFSITQRDAAWVVTTAIFSPA